MFLIVFEIEVFPVSAGISGCRLEFHKTLSQKPSVAVAIMIISHIFGYTNRLLPVWVVMLLFPISAVFQITFFRIAMVSHFSQGGRCA